MHTFNLYLRMTLENVLLINNNTVALINKINQIYLFIKENILNLLFYVIYNTI